MERTCLVTKQKAPASALFRFTVQGGQLVFDTDVKQAGRGGYVVKSEEALEKLPKLRGKLAHFLKVRQVEISADEVEKVRQMID